MNALVERVLPIRAGLPPDNGTGLIIDRFSLQVNMLAIAFHVKLLQVGTEILKVLVIRQYRDRLRSKEVVIPDANQP